jgi:multiple sugar transport system permease protein
MTNLIALTLNLVGMLVIYSLMAFALVRVHWHRRGAISVITMIFVAGLFWIVPPFVLALGDRYASSPGSLWLANLLVSGASVVILCQRVRCIPQALEDSARMDGNGWLGTNRHIVFPLIRLELALITFLTAMATSLLLWAALTASPLSSRNFPPWLYLLHPMEAEHGPGLAKTWFTMIAGSLVMTLPVILIFLVSKRYLLRHNADIGGMDSVPSMR